MYRDENRQNHETEPNTYPISGQCTTRVARASEGCSSNGKKTASSPLHDVSDVDGAQLLSKRFYYNHICVKRETDFEVKKYTIDTLDQFFQLTNFILNARLRKCIVILNAV